MVVSKKQLDELLDSCTRSIESSRYLSQATAVSVLASRELVTSSIALIRQSDLLIQQLGLGIQTIAAEPGTPPASITDDLLQRIAGKDFKNEIVELDGCHLINCRLSGCTLRYNGQPVILESTSFEECRFEFGAEAALTVQFLECFGLMLPDKPIAYARGMPVPLRQQRLN